MKKPTLEQKHAKSLIELRRMQLATAQRNLNDARFGCDHFIVKLHSSAICDICGKHFGWWCPDSKDNICEYDSVKDPVHDFCLYCGHPDERK